MHLEEVVQKHKKSFGECRPAVTKSSLCSGMAKKQGQRCEKICDFVSTISIDNWIHIWCPCFQHTDVDLGGMEKSATESRLKM